MRKVVSYPSKHLISGYKPYRAAQQSRKLPFHLLGPRTQGTDVLGSADIPDK